MSSASPPLQRYTALASNTYRNVHRCPKKGKFIGELVYYSPEAFQIPACSMNTRQENHFASISLFLFSTFLPLVLYFSLSLAQSLTPLCLLPSESMQGGLCRLLSRYLFVSKRQLICKCSGSANWHY